MSLFTILLAGPVQPTERLRRAVAGSRSIAADAGLRHAEALGLEPELWVGDFDSADPALRRDYAAMAVQSYPADKAKTDGELAVDAALDRGATSLLLVGAFGGARTDHAYFHMALAISLTGRGVPTHLASGREEGRVLHIGSNHVDLPAGATFSVLGFSALSGLTIRNARWPLRDHDVPFGSTLTISNQAHGPLEVLLGAGTALLIAQLPER